MDIYNAKDIAQHLMVKKTITNSWKLQKLLFFIQAMSFRILGQPMFKENIEAWKDGPVVATIRTLYKYEPEILYSSSDRMPLKDKFNDIIDLTLELFGKKTPRELRDLSHIKGGAWEKTYSTLGRSGIIDSELMKKEIELHEDINNFLNQQVEIDETQILPEVKDIINNIKVLEC